MVDLAKARTLLDKLDSGKKVSRRDLRAALGDEGLEEYERRWQDELDRRKFIEHKPVEIKEYEALVHCGDFYENRADGAKGKTAMKLRNMAETKYERAIEYLNEIIECDGNLRIWFDRDLDFDANTTTLGLDRDSIARTITSRSNHKLSEGIAENYSKEFIKRQLLTDAIANGGVPGAMELTAEQREKLAAKLKKTTITTQSATPLSLELKELLKNLTQKR